MKNNKILQEVTKVKKRIIFSTCVIAIFSALSVTAFAAESTPTAIPILVATSTSAAISTTESAITLDPDDPAYPLAQIVEGITTTKRINANGKTEIILSIPNKKVGELNLFWAKAKEQIIHNISEVCTDIINDSGYNQDTNLVNDDDDEDDEDYFEISYDMTQDAYIDTVEIITDTPNKVEFKITGLIPEDIYEQLLSAVVGDVGKTLINQTASIIDSNIKKSEKDLKNYKNLLKHAPKKHLKNDIKSIRAKIYQTTIYLNQLEELKISVDNYKDKDDDDDDD